MSSQLEELEKLYAKQIEIKVPKEPQEGERQATLMVKPLSIDEMGCFNMKEDSSIDVMVKDALEMLSCTLCLSKEEVGKIQFSHMMELFDTIVEINDLPDEQKSKISKVKSFMAEKQEAKELEKKDEPETDKPTAE